MNLLPYSQVLVACQYRAIFRTKQKTLAICLLVLCASVQSKNEPGVEFPSDATTELKFLYKIRNLTSSPPITPKHIADVFGWTLKEFKQPLGQRYWTQDYDLGEDQNVVSTKLSGGMNSINFSMRLKQASCITGDDVLTIFGNQYKRMIVMYDPYPTNISAIVKKNMSRFNGGPIYRIENNELITKIAFYFTLSECADHIEIHEPKHPGANQ